MTWPKALLTMELLQTSKVKGRKGTQPILFGTATALPRRGVGGGRQLLCRSFFSACKPTCLIAFV